MRSFFVLSVLIVFLSGCGVTQVKESFFGLEKKDYVEPTSGDMAELTVLAPKLKTQFMLQDKIRVSFYNSCSNSDYYRGEGYIGGFELSSKEEIGKSRTVKIDAHKPLFVELGYDQKNFQCTNKFRILPEAQSRYQIDWQAVGIGCRAEGVKISDGKAVASEEIVQQNNKGSFWSGGSGRTTSEWRACK